jgi:hypothetical protein
MTDDDTRKEHYLNLLLLRGRLTRWKKVNRRRHKALNVKGTKDGPCTAATSMPVKGDDGIAEGFTLEETVDIPVEIDAYYFKRNSRRKMGDRRPKSAAVDRSLVRFISTTPPPANMELTEAEQVALPGRCRR